jgi:hypothetical protein
MFELTTVRLAIDDGQHRLYLAAGIDPDNFTVILHEPMGGGGSGHPRWVLSAKGASLMSSGSVGDGERIVCGAVSDQVEHVRVNGADALLRNNAYLAVISSPLESIEVTTPDGMRSLELHPRTR